MKRPFSLFLNLFILLALSACGTIPASPSPTPKPSRLPDPDDVKALLVQLVDVEKLTPGIVVGMIAADPQERWVVGYGRLSATDQRVPDGDTVFEIGSITKGFTGILLAQAVLNGAQANLSRLQRGATSDQIAAARSQLEAARARAKLAQDAYISVANDRTNAPALA
jgi:CubicO group peptidase (beta-lactamase class C family)